MMLYFSFTLIAVIDDYMDLQQWRTCYRSLFRVTSLLNDSKSLVLGVISNEDSTDVTLASQLNKDFLKKRDDEEVGKKCLKLIRI